MIRRLWTNYSLSLTLLALLLVSWTLQTWMGWHAFADEQGAHGGMARVWGPGGYIWTWGESTFENWQSEFLQLLAFVVLTATLVHRGSHESRDADEIAQASLDRIEARLIRLESRDARIDEEDEALDRLVFGRVARLKTRDALRDRMPPPRPRPWQH